MHNVTYRMKDGSWQVIISYKEKGRWHQKSKQGFPSKKEAKQYEPKLLEEIKKLPRPVIEGMEDITLMEFCKTYLHNNKNLSLPTQQHYTQAVKSLVGLANKPMHRITYLDIQTAVSGWNTKPGTQSLYRAKLNVLFKAAVKPYRIISDNPMADVTIPKERSKKEKRVLTKDEERKVLSLNNLALDILYYTGLRKGEMIALTWDDIKWKDNSLVVNKQLALMPTGELKESPVKSRNGYREIPLPTALVKKLKSVHDTQPMDIHKRLFPKPHYTYKTALVELKKISPDLTPHCLRHTYATNLLSKGIDVQTVAALLGDNVNTVINTYIHYSDEMRKAAAVNIQKIFAQNF